MVDEITYPFPNVNSETVKKFENYLIILSHIS